MSLLPPKPPEPSVLEKRLNTLGDMIAFLLWSAFFLTIIIVPIYVILHFIIKYW
jgi:hypothetical protein